MPAEPPKPDPIVIAAYLDDVAGELEAARRLRHGDPHDRWRYLDEIDASEDLTQAEAWQRVQSWAIAQDLTRKNVPETTLEELRRDQETALARVARRRGNRG
jgi:hypothetical protein